jgi:hypothetical protein
MAMLTIQEYLNAQGKTIEKPYNILDNKVPQSPNAPAKNLKKGKTYSFPAALDSKPNPYISSTIKIDAKKDDQKGLASFGTPGIDFEAKEKPPEAVSQLDEHCGCEKKKAPFVVAYSSGAYHPDPIQAIKYIVYLTNENDNILKALMHEARKMGCLGKYTDYLTRTPELYKSLQKKASNEGPDAILHKMGLSPANESTEKKNLKNILPIKRKDKDSEKTTKSIGDSAYSKGISDYAT